MTLTPSYDFLIRVRSPPGILPLLVDSDEFPAVRHCSAGRVAKHSPMSGCGMVKCSKHRTRSLAKIFVPSGQIMEAGAKAATDPNRA